eukprot:CAMPEP_0173410064 /NCGR_PEP_ID=MMETSP1356-20130122/73713_1 /TAXON_ID=77927 ORGANISM="Hemiselmis virescens, Strain PCC157" /NCGR_SAMPLE_ID=MMETSP1356 /ASSEMBLY_ACC=CAM_ASM_000847 /LENGTH=51 /DNA_ID=CAMNT_0014371643 /DNA_START=58 /DNA_END=209 /DNA_ORIENTATION=-
MTCQSDFVEDESPVSYEQCDNTHSFQRHATTPPSPSQTAPEQGVTLKIKTP